MKIVNKNKNILVVDDDQSVTASMTLMLKQNGYSSVVADSPTQALSILNSQHVDLVIQDMNFSRKTTGEEGMALLEETHKTYPTLPILLMTAWGSISLAVAGIRNGAVDFITKPWNNDRLLQTINTTLRLSEPVSDNVLSREELDAEFNFSEIIGNDPTLLKVLTTVARVSKTDAAVMILGDSGTGKELIANAIHNNSLRVEGPLVKVNLGGISTSLFESEMFGHVKGAFTDAKTDREGRFSLANNGTIFLDEIGDLDKASQVKILRVLQDQTYQVVGSSLNKHSNVRVISATNKNLDEMIVEGSFREDLLYRLNLITINLPPLRERSQDIKQLAENHLLQIEKMYGLQSLSISSNALRWMEKQQWPGNIRQLKQSIERAVLMSGHSVLTTADMTQQSETTSTSLNESVESISKLTLDEVEEIMINKTLETYNGHITKVAKSLGLSRAALYRRIEKYEISL